MVKRKYIAPNAITTANMFFGYLSITSSIKQDFIQAIWFIIFAMICDTLDGKTARKLDAFSEFGKEFDSFCDAISFGLAPGILVYSILMKNTAVNSFIIPVSFIYALCGVMRLVKFNIITVASSEKDDFSGMPIPNAAAMVCSYYLLTDTALFNYLKDTYSIDLFSIDLFMAITVIAAILMVSTIKFKTPDRAFSFIPKKMALPLIGIVIVTLKYSLFILSFLYVIINLIGFLKKVFDGSNDDNDKELVDVIEEIEIEEKKKED
ncbi:CDP-diacylglycerol--serine O-phosphatidyltransferase [uncultured Fusobacterium sp.]|uniref:CDP-diacylglycerol--serine O-phosphatidyltransferase n=1 Tax=uncultured Fusobacterium sp. TaxID=159267 RepID=UPI0025E70C74|nr:CDP-diacylglycerol--serine O-phosphatidyltransferase [uncultured Fusobacterium sp.]